MRSPARPLAGARGPGHGGSSLSLVAHSDDRRPRWQEWKSRAAPLGKSTLEHPMRALIPLSLIALAIELAQYRQEWILGGHAIGELVRNLAYALIGALVFNWLIVEIPQRRRRRAAYAYHRLHFEVLIGTGPGLLAQYRFFQPPGEPALDSWSQNSVFQRAKVIEGRMPVLLGPQRANLLANSIIGIQAALDGMRSSQFFFDPDVAHALGLFPGTVGLNQLQVATGPNGHVPSTRDAHIVWELLEASRRLYSALRRNVPDISFHLGQTPLGGNTRESDLLPPAEQQSRTAAE